MTILSMNKAALEKAIGKVDEAMEKTITDMGTPIEYVNDEEVAVEVFPNRPDLLSLQNFARAVNQYRGKSKVASFKIHPAEKDYLVTIDKSVKKVRPHTVCAIVKGLKFNDEKIIEIIDIQEKLHNSIGRKRKKVAVGIYPLEEIKLPIKFLAKKPEEIKFKPLEFPRAINGRQILGQHPAGRDYADLLKDEEVFPIFMDGNNEVMSMPPIINSHKTGRINEKTRDVFIECSGHNLHYLNKTMAIIIATLSDMGGKIYGIKIKDATDGDRISPEMGSSEMNFKVEDINKMLGTDFDEKKIKSYLARMGIGIEKDKAKIPAYRTDILHWVDLTEEVAIAHGYDNFEPIIPEISTIAEENPESKQKKVISNILAGLGLLEVSSFHLNVKKDVKKIHYDKTDFIEIEDSKTGRDVLRSDLLTNMMQTLYENSDASYPHKIFEIGKVFSPNPDLETGIEEKDNLSLVLADEKVSFSDLKQILDYLMKMMGIEYSIKDGAHVGMIAGRCGEIFVDGKSIGFIGEISPRVLKNWKVKMPAVALEIELKDFLRK
jgi:phenylalanyl-tRNA synthetase beta chain